MGFRWIDRYVFVAFHLIMNQHTIYQV